MRRSHLNIFLLRITVCVVFALASSQAFSANDSITVYGYVYDVEDEVLKDFPVFVNGSPIIKTDSKGRYEVRLPARKRHKLAVDYFGEVIAYNIRPLKPNSVVKRDFKFSAIVMETKVIDSHKRTEVPEVEPKDLERFAMFNIEGALTVIGIGVRKRDALSSSYNVRGGNFDENLIYINDIEVYRPFLARSGQQEGMSFINPFMTKNISFSSGGFAAKYGDKMSSVLDVQYNKPKSFSGSIELSMLGGSIHIQDRPGDGKRFTYVVGARYRSLQYILGSLDVSGDYRPRFTDFQALLGFKLKPNWKLSWFSTYSHNQYVVEPQSRETNFGTIQNAVRLFVGFGGSERIEYRTFLNALSLKYEPNDSTSFKLISSSFDSKESEHFTVEGAYRLEELENNLGSDNFAEVRALLGYGYFINHARNDLKIDVYSHKALAKIKRGKHTLETGVKYQNEVIFDKLKEWNYNDSSQYRVNASEHDPYQIVLDDFINTTNQINSFRVMAYIQDRIMLNPDYNFKLNVGVRSNYWSLNGQNLISPRLRFSIEPNKKFNKALREKIYAEWDSVRAQNDSIEVNYMEIANRFEKTKKRDLLINAAFGAYGQPPFYRELRNIRGELNTNLQAQRSYHMVLGSDMMFKAWDRKFRFISELYYKRMTDLVPYTINNVKLRYDALNSSEGYAYGFDARINGEFVSGLESWINLSLLSTKENITYRNEDNELVETGYIKRPTDQRVNFSILFQDELPIDTTFKLQLNLVIGSKMPYYFNGPFRYSENYSLPAYRRVDIGFSKEVKRFTKDDGKGGRFNSLWMSLEIFNILQVNNVASYIWVKDLQNNLYGVPNYLTGRRLNFKIIGRF